MALISYTDAKSLADELRPQYDRRHFQLSRLRSYWHGRYWDQIETQTQGIASLFRDVTSVKTDIGPDFKLVRNLAFDVCVKYQSFLSGLPMIRTFIDNPDSRNARAKADLKERVLYATWSQVNMNHQLNQTGWFGPLMGDSFLGIWPDFDLHTVKCIVRSPEHAYPIISYDGMKLDALIFRWKTTASKAGRDFPNWTGGNMTGNQKTIEIMEYSDEKQFVRWVGSEQVNGVEHDLGFNLFDQVPFIHVPGEPFNHGAVEQSINMIEAGNALWSLEMQAAIDNVFPRLILEDPMKFGETIDTGAGAVIPVNPGGKAYYLSTPNSGIGGGMLPQYEAAIKQDTFMPDASFGQFDASIITGKAINALQGAGTGSVVEMVQGTSIGTALENWNEKALTIYQRMFPNDTIMLEGVRPGSAFDLNPKQFSMVFKGKDIVGSPKNEVVFMPYMNQHDKLVMSLQGIGAGLYSKKYGRDQTGVVDSDAMQEEIISEVLEEAVIGALVQALQQEPTQQNADQTEAQVNGIFTGATNVVRARPPLGAAQPSPPGGGPGGSPSPGGGPPGPAIGTLPGGGQVVSPPLPEPQGAAPPVAGPGAPSPGAPQAPPPGAQGPQATTAPVSLTSVQRAFQGVQGLTGKVWIVGQLAVTGTVTGNIDIALTAPADRQTISSGLPQYQFTFHIIKGTPAEKAVQVA
jgi:hypothetical protein